MKTWGQWGAHAEPCQHHDLSPLQSTQIWRGASCKLTGDNKRPIVCVWVRDCVCVSLWWWKWRVEDNPDEETVTRCHVMGGSKHNGHLKKKVNNINPCWCSPQHPSPCTDPSPTHKESHWPAWALYSHIMARHSRPALFTLCLNPMEHAGLHPVTAGSRITVILIFLKLLQSLITVACWLLLIICVQTSQKYLFLLTVVDYCHSSCLPTLQATSRSACTYSIYVYVYI